VANAVASNPVAVVIPPPRHREDGARWIPVGREKDDLLGAERRKRRRKGWESQRSSPSLRSPSLLRARGRVTAPQVIPMSATLKVQNRIVPIPASMKSRHRGRDGAGPPVPNRTGHDERDDRGLEPLIAPRLVGRASQPRPAGPVR
jgi:hypothetical protein